MIPTNLLNKAYLSFFREEPEDCFEIYIRSIPTENEGDVGGGMEGLNQAPFALISLAKLSHIIPNLLYSGQSIPLHDLSGNYSIPEDLKLDFVDAPVYANSALMDFSEQARWGNLLFYQALLHFIPESSEYSAIPESLPMLEPYDGSGLSGGGGASGEWEKDGSYFLPPKNTIGYSWKYAGWQYSVGPQTAFKPMFVFAWENCEIPYNHILKLWDTEQNISIPYQHIKYAMNQYDIATCHAEAGDVHGFPIRDVFYGWNHVIEVLIGECTPQTRWYPTRGGGAPVTGGPSILGGLSGGGGASGEWENQFLAPFPGKKVEFEAEYKIYIGDFPLWLGSSPVYY
jgi:hypothetical protein